MTAPQRPDDVPDRIRYPPHDPPASARDNPGPPMLSILGFVCAALALLLCPVLFGPAGIVFGYLAHSRGERYGRWAALVSAVGLVLGLVIGLIVYNR